MKRVLLLASMLLSLWPVGAIAASAFSESSTTYTEGDSAVTYRDDGDATVTIGQSDTGSAKAVTLPIEAGGTTYSCPLDVNEKRAPYDGVAGRTKADIQDVKRELDRLGARYPAGVAPSAIVRRYNSLRSREKRLIARFNGAIDKSNAILESYCTVAAG
jgi:hypothetical protein